MDVRGTLLWPDAVCPRDLHANAVETFARSNVQRFGIVPPTKAAVGREFGRLDVGAFMSGVREYHDSKSVRTTHGCVDVSLFIDGHPIDTGLFAEIDQDSFRAQ